MNFGKHVCDDSTRGVTSEGSISPSFSARAVLSSTAQKDAEVDAESRECRNESSCADLDADDGQDLVLGVQDKRRRTNVEDLLESEGDVPAGDLEEFVDRMGCMGVERNTDRWRRFWREHAEIRLEHDDPVAWAEYVRRRREMGEEGAEIPEPPPPPPDMLGLSKLTACILLTLAYPAAKATPAAIGASTLPITGVAAALA